MLQLNVTKIDLSKSIPLKNPLVIHLELTNKCNFSCQYCPESLEDFNERVGGAKSMSREEFEKIAMQIKQLGKVSVLRLWIMGEPLLNPNLYDFIKIAKLGGGLLTKLK
jgi:MoaA/NifB/PqqE/SkfB family radical SAM enzyme